MWLLSCTGRWRNAFTCWFWSNYYCSKAYGVRHHCIQKSLWIVFPYARWLFFGASKKKTSLISLKQSYINNNTQVVKNWTFIKVNELVNFRLIFRLQLNLDSLLMQIKFLYHYVTCILKVLVTWFSLDSFFIFCLFKWLCWWKKGWWRHGRCRYGIKLIQLSVFL